MPSTSDQDEENDGDIEQGEDSVQFRGLLHAKAENYCRKTTIIIYVSQILFAKLTRYQSCYSEGEEIHILSQEVDLRENVQMIKDDESLPHIQAGHTLESLAHPVVEDAVHVVAVSLGHARHTSREKLNSL